MNERSFDVVTERDLFSRSDAASLEAAKFGLGEYGANRSDVTDDVLVRLGLGDYQADEYLTQASSSSLVQRNNIESLRGTLRTSPSKPPVDKLAQVRVLRHLCDEMMQQLDEIKSCLADGDDCSGPAAEFLNLLERLYALPFGNVGDESLKRVVVAIESQVVNADWTRGLCSFIQEVLETIRVRWVIDQATIDGVYDLMRKNGLDAFRGTLSDSGFVKQYKIVEATD